MQYLWQGLLLGFAYVMPIGAQNIFVINTALTQPRKRILATAAIVFFFDVTLSVACFFGIGALMSLSVWIELAVLGVGSIAVIKIGWSIFRSKGSLTGSGEDVNIPIGKVIWTACVVTWFNPQALIDGTMLLGAFRASLPGSAGLMFILGVAIASGSWWFGMSTVVSLFKSKINDKALRIINIVCGLIIMFYGAKLVYNFIQLVRESFF
ncbi:MAG: LysE/ArgO family amino acid transporter [Eubacterium sp.]|jgi:L-lysine exporter family protein LysE/ArgO